MIRSSVVFPDPDGPSSASNSPLATLRSTPSSAVNAPNVLVRFLTSMLMRQLSFVQMPFENGFHNERDQRQHREQRSDRKGRDELVLVVENLHQQRHCVGLAADMA